MLQGFNYYKVLPVLKPGGGVYRFPDQRKTKCRVPRAASGSYGAV